jgi:gluconokinase
MRRSIKRIPPLLIVTFGLPGAGKTYVARAFTHFGLVFHDGDDDLPDEMRARIAASLPIDDNLRDQFFARIGESVNQLWPEHPRLVVAQTFIKEKYRVEFLTRFPLAHFVLVEADNVIRAQRLAARTYQPLAPDYVQKMDQLFEPPHIPYARITNNVQGRAHLDGQIEALLTDFALPQTS